MNRSEIIKKLKEYNLDIKRYIIISGTAMVLYGIKEETPDIDISVTESLETELLEDYIALLEHTNPDGKMAYIINGELNFGQEYYTENKAYIEGLPIQKVEDILKLKQSLSRPKDETDIKRIMRFIQKQKETI